MLLRGLQKGVQETSLKGPASVCQAVLQGIPFTGGAALR